MLLIYNAEHIINSSHEFLFSSILSLHPAFIHLTSFCFLSGDEKAQDGQYPHPANQQIRSHRSPSLHVPYHHGDHLEAQSSVQLTNQQWVSERLTWPLQHKQAEIYGCSFEPGLYCKGVLGKTPVVLSGLYEIIFHFTAARVPSG